MNPFEVAMRAADAAIDATMQEEFSFYPMTNGIDLGPTQDPYRDQIPSLIAVWEGPQRVDGEPRFQRTTIQPRIRVMADKIRQGVKQGDRFYRVKDGTFYEVVDMQPDSQGMRLNLPVRLIVS